MAQPKPESLGFSSQRLGRLHEAMQRQIDEQSLAGVVTLVMRHGKLVEQRSYGMKDLASGAPMTDDTIFRIYSMTKPVTGVAMMILYEEGKWHPADPISKYIPEFADVKVFKGVDANGAMVTEAPVHPPTMAELLTHTAGLTYGLFGATPVDKLYGQRNCWAAANLQLQAQCFAGLPLLYQPGSKWVYSVSMDVQGAIIEKLSGKSLPDFMEERIFKPLGMTRYGFLRTEGKAQSLCHAVLRRPGREAGDDGGGGGAEGGLCVAAGERPRGAAAWCRPRRTTRGLRRCCSITANSMASACSRRPPWT